MIARFFVSFSLLLIVFLLGREEDKRLQREREASSTPPTVEIVVVDVDVGINVLILLILFFELAHDMQAQQLNLLAAHFIVFFASLRLFAKQMERGSE